MFCGHPLWSTLNILGLDCENVIKMSFSVRACATVELTQNNKSPHNVRDSTLSKASNPKSLVVIR